MPVAEPKTSPKQSSQYVDFDEFIEFQLKKTRSGIHHTDILSSVVVLCAAVLGYLLLFVVFDHWIIPGGVSYLARVSLLGLLVFGSLGWLVWKIALPYMRQVNALYAAREIERSHPELKSSLLSWVDLRNSGKPVSPQILKALEKRTALNISNSDIDEAVDRRVLMRSSYVLLTIVALLCAYTVFSPKNITTSLWRALFPTSSVTVATTTKIVEVTPGNTEVLARDQVDVTVDLDGTIPEETTLLFSTADRRFVDEPIIMRNTGEGLPRFRGRLTGENGEGLLKDVTYRVVAGDAESPNFTITVNQPPHADVTGIVYDYPEYMSLDDKTQDGANIDAWEGTWVTVKATPNMELTRAVVQCSDEADGEIRAEEYPMVKNSAGIWEAKWQLKIRSDGTSANYYHVQVWNDKDQTDPLPTHHRIKIRPDLKPEVTLIHPTKDLDVPLNAVIPIAFKTNDPDFMLRRVDLKIEKAGEILPVSPRLFSAPPDTSEFNSTYRLNVEKFRFEVGDQFSFYIQAQDNREAIDGISNDTTNSPKITVTIIEPQSKEEVEQFEQEQQQELKEQLDPANNEPQENGNRQPQEKPEQGMEEQPNEADPENMGEDNTEPGDPNNMPNDGEPGTEQRSGDGGTPQEKPANGGNSQEQSPNGEPGKEQQPNENGTGEGQPNENMQPPNKGEQDPNRQPNNQQPNDSDPNNSQPQDGRKPGEGTKPNEQTEPGEGSKPRDKAAEDEALKKLIEWNKEQQEKNGEKPDQQDPNQQNSDQEMPNENSTNENSEQNSNDTNATENSNGEKPNESNSPESGASSDNKTPNEPNTPGTEPMPNEGTDPNKGSNPNSDQDPQGMNEPKAGETPSGEPMPNEGTNPNNTNPPQEGNSPNDASKPPMNSGENPANGSQDPMDGMGETTPSMEKNPDGKPSPNSDPMNSDPNSTDPKNGDPNDPNQKPGDPNNSEPKSTDPNSTEPNTEGTPSDKPESGDKPKSGDPAKSGDMSNPNENSSEKPQDPNTKPNENGENNKPSDQKTMDGKPSESQPSDGKSTDQKPNKMKPNEGDPKQPQDGKPSDGKPQDGKPSDGKSQDGKPSDGKSQNGEPKDGKSQEGKPSDGKSTDGKPQDGKPQDGKPTNGKSQDGKPQEGKPGDGKPQDGKPADGKPQDGKPSDGKSEGGKPSDGESQEGQPSEGKPQDGKPSEQGSKTSKSMGPGKGDSPANGPLGNGEGEGTGTPSPEEADLENKKKATNLALKRLQDQLERGDAPKELMDELGYSEKELESFMNRLEERLADPGIDQSPESTAERRQFESLLKGIDYQSTGEVREGGDRERNAAQGFGSANRPVPPEYRLDNEAYKRKLSREGSK